jgi:hypothetical protein
MKFKSLVAALLFSTFTLYMSVLGQGTAFTYQGRLNDGGIPANGIYDLRFAIYDGSVGGNQQGLILTNAATFVSNGLFTVVLDFDNQFPGASRWLEIAVRSNGVAGFITLAPRQELTPAPYAITAGNVAPGGNVAGNGGGLTNVNAANVGGLTAAKFWQLGGNAGFNPATDFLGTAGAQPLQIRAPGGVGIGTAVPLAPLQIVSSNNSVPQLQLSQDMTNNFGRLRMNVTGSPSWEMDVSSGQFPFLSFWNATQRVLFDYFGNVYALSFNGGGTNLTGLNAGNVSSGTLSDSRLSSNVALRSGGNSFTGDQSIINGTLHVFSASSSPEFQITQTNTNDYTRLRMNVSGSPSWEMDVSPGATPLLEFWNSTLRMVLDYNGRLGIGTGSPDSPLHVSSGGSVSQAHFNQTVSGNYARLNLTVNDGNLWRIGVTDTGGSTPGNLEFTTDEFVPRMRIDRAGNVYSIGGFNGSSDRNLKENFRTVSPREVLDKVAALPITRWNFKTDAGTVHIGPMAQDFYAAFGVGPDDKHIATVDADGVALAAIQGLNEKLEARSQKSENRIQKLEAENARLEEQNEFLAKRLEALEQTINRTLN